VSSQGLSFYFVIPVSLVLREDNPRSFGDKLQPLFVRRTAREVIAMAMMLDTAGYQDVEDRLAIIEVFIQIKDEIVKLQLRLGFPSGLPLRSALVRGHIPWPNPVPTRGH